MEDYCSNRKTYDLAIPQVDVTYNDAAHTEISNNFEDRDEDILITVEKPLNSEIRQIQYSINGGVKKSVVLTSGTQSYTQVITSEEIKEGENTIWISVTYQRGNFAYVYNPTETKEYEQIVRKDTQAPVILVNPVDNDTWLNSKTVTFSIQ